MKKPVFVNENILDTTAQAIVNPVNCEGVAGKGLACQLKQVYRQSFTEYCQHCKNKTFGLDTELLASSENGKTIICLPTKNTWKENSKIEYIIKGLNKLYDTVIKNNIESVAIPMLGTGNGSLDKDTVRELLIMFSRTLPEVQIFIYENDFEKAEPEENMYLAAYAIIKLRQNKYNITPERLDRILPFDNAGKVYQDLKKHCSDNKLSLVEFATKYRTETASKGIEDIEFKIMGEIFSL